MKLMGYENDTMRSQYQAPFMLSITQQRVIPTIPYGHVLAWLILEKPKNQKKFRDKWWTSKDLDGTCDNYLILFVEWFLIAQRRMCEVFSAKGRWTPWIGLVLRLNCSCSILSLDSVSSSLSLRVVKVYRWETISPTKCQV